MRRGRDDAICHETQPGLDQVNRLLTSQLSIYNLTTELSNLGVDLSTDSPDYQIIWLIRRLFRALAQRSNDNLRDLGVTAADRAVMQFLHPGEQLSVPEIASRYQVSRQNIQPTANRLLGAGLVTTRENPRRKRSPQVGLTKRGTVLFARIMKRDLDAIDSLFVQISRKERQITRNTLEKLLEKLK